MEVIVKELDIPREYVRLVDGRITLTIHRSWIRNLLTAGSLAFVKHDRFTVDEIAAQPSLEELGSGWERVYAKVYKKQHKKAIVLPPWINTDCAKFEEELSFAQVLQYVANTNYRNLWKEFYKKYQKQRHAVGRMDRQSLTPEMEDVDLMQELLSRVYNCPTIRIEGSEIIFVASRNSNLHCNLLPALCTIETSSALVTFFEQTAKHSLRECVMFSPAILSSSYGKPLFIVYQLLRLARDLHDLGLTLGEITLSDVLLMDNLTIQVLPRLEDNVYLWSSIINDTTTKQAATHKTAQSLCTTKSERNIEKLCESWVRGEITNFDYLTALNDLAGRRYGDPSCHHVIPWVTDFTSRSGGNWRDLTKSKFRLNKGDRQLDLTFDSQSSEVGHHVSDVLSEITYYVYLSRRYSRSILCKHVRPLWVPWEYPASIQRMHDWSPDECIPQFFTDPTVFKSIHEDLPDLEVPSWATSPEDFIEKHREALESPYVSERLHHWIDLTFGYKLSGTAAVKSKNVCLQLVDNHTSLTGSGIVQLFTQPHPQRLVPSPYWGKVPPRLCRIITSGKMKSDRSADRINEDEVQVAGLDEESSSPSQNATTRSSPLALSRLLSRSRGSLQTPEESSRHPEKSSSSQIILPKDYNPVTALVQVETLHAFLNRASNKVHRSSDVQKVEEFDEASSYESFKHLITCDRIKDRQTLGCLVVELFLAGKLRAVGHPSLRFRGRTSRKARRRQRDGRCVSSRHRDRLLECVNALRACPDALPRCARTMVALLLRINDVVPRSYNAMESSTLEAERDEDSEVRGRAKTKLQVDEKVCRQRYPPVTYVGLPPPSAHQFLQPILASHLFPFSSYFRQLYRIVEMLREYDDLARELSMALGSDDEIDPSLASKTRTAFLCKMSECKVKAVARELDALLPRAGIAGCEDPCFGLIVGHVRQILEDPYGAVLAAWYLFDPVAKTLGPKTTADTFLNPIVKLYEVGSAMDGSVHADVLPTATLAKFRTMRLYHRSFLLKLIVRLGLRRFLENFVAPMVEAVGGYRDHLGGCRDLGTRRAGNLKNCDLEDAGTDPEATIVLSPLEEDSSLDSEQNVSSTSAPAVNEANLDSTSNENEEVFTLDAEEDSPSEEPAPAYNPDLVVDPELSSELEYEETSTNSPQASGSGPTIAKPIPIPARNHTSDDGLVCTAKLAIDLNTIGCHVGSKTPSEDAPFDGSYVPHVSEDSLTSSTDSDGSKPDTLKKLETVQRVFSEREEARDAADESEETGPGDEDDEEGFEEDEEDDEDGEDDEDEEQTLTRTGEDTTDGLETRSEQSNSTARRSTSNECKVSEMSVESIVWLSHRLGPVLTARYLSRNLLRMLTLCYAGKESLTNLACPEGDLDGTTLVGDRSAEKVLECLEAIAGVYGEQIIVLQYFAHATKLLALCKRKLMVGLEGGLVSCLVLLIHAIPCLSDSTLMDVLHETILKSILHPTVRLISTTRYVFPNGSTARHALADKYLRALLRLAQRLGNSATSVHLAGPIHRFFLAFDKAFGYRDESSTMQGDEKESRGISSASHEEDQVPIRYDSSQLRDTFTDAAADSYSPPVTVESNGSFDSERSKALGELKSVFTVRFARKACSMFHQYLGDASLELVSKSRLIRDLCHEEGGILYDTSVTIAEDSSFSSYSPEEQWASSDDASSFGRDVGSFGNISLIGNKIEVQKRDKDSSKLDQARSPDHQVPPSPWLGSRSTGRSSRSSQSSSSSQGRQLRGNWLAYWEHEIGRSDKDSAFNVKQIKLQSFNGHSNSVRSLHVLDNENSFMSGSRDKTVKLWSLRSQGDGSTVSSCQYTYTGHKKSILALTFVESVRYVATCDGSIHCWDPFMGSLVGSPETTRPVPINTLAACPAPSNVLLAATVDVTLRLVDCRTVRYTNELKISTNPSALIRRIAVAPSGHWVALGQASGFLTILDVRTGLIIASWRGHECEILQLEAVNETTIISSSLDQTVTVWSAIDGKLKFHMKGITEPVHCMAIYEQQLISGTTANRIGVHTAVQASTTFSSTKLRSDTFKGVLTAMTVLPLNRLLLLGADNGGISLLC
ncbi:WD repeat-containing protein 81 [Orussus abietinus]|uniref:WD repeat-containing protein 81 n=1 Tax=Orussus abietinus TaxID=222816 RepID=UPI000625C0B1|nr:WD repeat-containing protein 81 [Orussus abietinus]